MQFGGEEGDSATLLVISIIRYVRKGTVGKGIRPPNFKINFGYQHTHLIDKVITNRVNQSLL